VCLSSTLSAFSAAKDECELDAAWREIVLPVADDIQTETLATLNAEYVRNALALHAAKRAVKDRNIP
jgi:propanediol dehydratase small subunit